MMLDFFGQQLEVGDEVAFEAPNYRWLVLGKIIAFTPQNVRLEYNNTWNGLGTQTFLTSPNSVIKKPK